MVGNMLSKALCSKLIINNKKANLTFIVMVEDTVTLQVNRSE